MRFCLIFGIILLLIAPALPGSAAVPLSPEEQLESASPAMRADALELWAGLRCMVCAGQSVAQSQAPLAQDIRQRVLNQLTAGNTPTAIRTDLAQRYGDAILLSPPARADTLPLWLLPFLFLALGLMLGWRRIRRKTVSQP